MVLISTLLRISFLLGLAVVVVLSDPRPFEVSELAGDDDEFLLEAKRSLGISQILQNDADRVQDPSISKQLQNDAERARQMEENLRRRRPIHRKIVIDNVRYGGVKPAPWEVKRTNGKNIGSRFIRKLLDYLNNLVNRRRDGWIG